MKEFFQVDPLHFQACLVDPEADGILVTFGSSGRKTCVSPLGQYLTSATESILTKRGIGAVETRDVYGSCVFLASVFTFTLPLFEVVTWEVGVGVLRATLTQASQRKSSVYLAAASVSCWVWKNYFL